ncbi:MAG: aldose 1-epimerase [Firmicutes bacterium]|nr:aldose 1-epimerase [Bacillota bacterium]
MSAYVVERRQDSGDAVYILRERISGTRAEVIPAIGAQCARFAWCAGGHTVDILKAPPSLDALREEPVQYGIPVLFPFPNRIAHGRFAFNGRTVELPITEPERGHAIHGLVLDRPWTVADFGTEDDSAYIVCTFDWHDHPEVHVFPYPFALEYTIRLTADGLHTRFRATNTGDGLLPMGFGLHPWFPVPLVTGGDPQTCRIEAPVTHMRELDDLIPTGRLFEPEAERDLRRGVQLGRLFFDHAFTGIEAADYWDAVYTDTHAGLQVVVRSRANLTDLVVYTPPDHSAVCLEPYSCATDAFNLEARGIAAGMVRLAPGDSWSTAVDILVRTAAGT